MARCFFWFPWCRFASGEYQSGSHGNGQESARQEEDAGVDRGRKEWQHYLAGSASLHFASRARVEGGGVGAWEAWSKGEEEWSCSLAWAAIAGLVRRVSMQDVFLLFKIRDGTPELGSGKGERDSLGFVRLLAILRHQSLSTKPSALILFCAFPKSSPASLPGKTLQQ